MSAAPDEAVLRVALCPHPPLLHRGLGGAGDPLAGLRAACVRALRELDGTGRLLVVAPDEHSGRHDPDLPLDVRRFGTTAPRVDGRTTAQPLGVARALLDEAGWAGPVEMRTVAHDSTGPATARDAGEIADAVVTPGRAPAGLLLLGDGSARRGEKAPGFLDERSFACDDAVAHALARGDAAALRDMDTDLASAMMVDGGPVLRLLGELGTRLGVRAARLDHREDPFGVSYFVARWDLGG